MKVTHKRENGFSIIEVVVAVALSVIALGALITLGVLTARTSQISKQRTQAMSLTKEAVERVRLIRDNISEFVSGSKPFSVYDSTNCGSSTYYAWNWSKTGTACPWKATNFVLKNDGSGWYLQAVTTNPTDNFNSAYQLASPYNDYYVRIIINDYSCGCLDIGKDVEVVVSWKDKGQTYSVSQKSTITDWR